VRRGGVPPDGEPDPPDGLRRTLADLDQRVTGHHETLHDPTEGLEARMLDVERLMWGPTEARQREAGDRGLVVEHREMYGHWKLGKALVRVGWALVTACLALIATIVALL
jgi:hypothetical protein